VPNDIKVKVSAPSRLHFGLFSAGNVGGLRFGGVGMTLDHPRVAIGVTGDDRLTISGPESAACQSALAGCFPLIQKERPDLDVKSAVDLPIAISIESELCRHVGLGSGTQLALATATAVLKYFEIEMPSIEEFTAIVGRGKRSAIGSYGFFQGGFLVDRGKRNNESLSPLDFRTDFPEQWPILVVRLNSDVKGSGLSGESETNAFQELPLVSNSQRENMVNIVRDRMIPGVLQTDYELFGEAVYEFGYQSGMMFESVQGGPYNGKEIENLIHQIRSMDILAVGQSSWGPSVFAIAQNKDSANAAMEKLQELYQDRILIDFTKADNHGVKTNIENS
jgi:beta-RFAP synthase